MSAAEPVFEDKPMITSRSYNFISYNLVLISIL